MNQMCKSKAFLFALVAPTILVASVQAQYRDPNSRPSPTPTPTPAPPSRPLRPINPSQMSGRLSQDVNQLPGIYGQIRWKKELGLPSTDSGMTADTTNCGAIRVRATVQERSASGIFQESDVGHYRIQDAPREANGYYVCSYSFTDRNDLLDLPRNRAITVSARLGAFADESLNAALASQPWFGNGQPQPPPGFQRVLVGSREVILTDTQARATVEFEIVYRAARMRP
jgi:hypothetical protein